ncbi:MAG: class I SAM-dependent methyltransferase [Magnetococcales bacterium]|nr:class I SAM-dependent methyltransferase [Magnetococcales bacterium]
MNQVANLVPSGETVLELGCGQGILVKKIADRCQKMIGVDYDERKCGMARKACKNFPNVTIVQMDILSFLESVSASSVDIAILADTLASNHLENQDKILTECQRILKKNGMIVLKIMDVHPKWKFRLSRLVSSLVYKVLRLSVSNNQQLFHQSSTLYVAKLRSLGFETKIIPLHQISHNPFSHLVICGFLR